MLLSLNYGYSGRFACEVDPGRVVVFHPGPPAREKLAGEVRTALLAPLDFPPLEQLCIPGDRVTLVLDRHTPAAETLIAEMWAIFEQRGVGPGGLHIMQPVALDGLTLPDPRKGLPEAIRDQVRWTIHDPTDEKLHAYLATTARGERVYLNREATDADVVLSVGTIAYDPVLGVRGTSSVFYPGLSTTDAITRARGEGHSELGPNDERPLRQSIDEIAWLLGTQFTVQVIPGVGTSAAAVLAGATDSVLRQGKHLLEELWSVRLPQRAEVVVVAIDADCAGHGWDQLGAALVTARNLVSKGGKVVVLSELAAEPGDGLNLIRQHRSPRNALQPIRRQAPLDMIPATQLASAADWSHIYLLSKLAGDVVDELFMTPLDNEREIERLLGGSAPCAFIGSAQHAFGALLRD
jgi:nickel-dependent lactate racemase